MVALDPFFSPKSRLGRAQTHIKAFAATAKAFVDSEPYARVTEPDDKGVRQLHKIKVIRELPPDLTHLAIEAIEAMRSALDQAGYAAAVLGGKQNPKSAYFPFADSVTELDTVIKGRCRDLPSEVVALFRTFEPYQRGNDALWAMNKMANAKHTALVPIGFMSNKFRIGNMRMIAPKDRDGMSAIVWPTWDGTKNEMVFGIADDGAELTYEKLEFSIHIAFGDVPAVAGKPTLAVLSELARVVEGVVVATEAECCRIGLIKPST